MKLSELKMGEKCKVVSIDNGNSLLKRRLLDMGITKNVEITINKVAPFGDPIDIKLRGYELCLRKSDLSTIEVIKLW